MECLSSSSPSHHHLHSALPLDHDPNNNYDDDDDDAMASSPHHQQHFLKMEDLHHPTAASPPSIFDDTTPSQSSPAPVVITSKPAKKRKSWGQELPEPKTNLPPRKRAKTDDEKEQRRIERIKRNRAAAHNSRERKRQETETLAVALARANAEIEAYRKLHGPLPAHIVLPEVHVSIDSGSTAPVQVHTPAPSLVDSHESQLDTPPSPTSPTDGFLTAQTPKIKPEPIDSPLIPASSALDNLDSKSALFPPLDLTQHSAVSVQRSEDSKPADLDDGFLVEQSLSLSDDLASPAMLSNPDDGPLDNFAFTDGALDASFNTPLNFSFDDLIDDSATFTVDAQASGAV